VHILLTEGYAQLKTGNHLHVKAFSPFDRFVESADVVVIGYRENIQPDTMSPLY
jgi:hypothetical protein